MQQARERSSGYRLGWLLGQAWKWQRRWEGRLLRRLELAGHPVACGAVRYGLLALKLALLAALLWVSFWVFLLAVFMAIAAVCTLNSGAARTKDYLWYQAYGDPYGEYELGHSPGQPDLDE